MYRLAVSLVILAEVFITAESRHIHLWDADLEDVSTDLDILENGLVVKTRPVSHAPMDVLEYLVDKVNQAMIREQKEYITVPSISFNVLIAKIGTYEGTVGPFSSLYLKGDEQMLKKTVVKGATIYNFDLKLGMKGLQLRYPYGYRYLLLFGNDGVIEMNSKDDAVHVVGVVNVKDDGTCRAVLSNVQLTNMGDYDVNITPTNFPSFLLEGMLSFFTNEFLPYFLPTVNTYIKRATAAADFSELICDNVVQNVTKVF